MKLLEMLKENNLVPCGEYEENFNRFKLDSYTKINNEVFLITIGKGKYKVFVHNYYDFIKNTKDISWCYTVEKFQDYSYSRITEFPKTIALIGTMLTRRQKELIPEVYIHLQ